MGTSISPRSALAPVEGQPEPLLALQPLQVPMTPSQSQKLDWLSTELDEQPPEQVWPNRSRPNTTSPYAPIILPSTHFASFMRSAIALHELRAVHAPPLPSGSRFSVVQ